MGRKLKDVLKDVHEEIAHIVKNTIKNVNADISSIVRDVDNAGQWITLAPFKEAMAGMLKDRGLPVPTKLDDIAKSFYINIILGTHFERFAKRKAVVGLDKQSNKMHNKFLHFAFFENRKTDLNNLMSDDAVNAAAGGISAAGAGLAGATGGISAIVAPIIAAILKWFHAKKKAQQTGAQLPADEQKALNTVDKTMAAVPDMVTPAGSGKGASLTPVKIYPYPIPDLPAPTADEIAKADGAGQGKGTGDAGAPVQTGMSAFSIVMLSLASLVGLIFLFKFVF